MAKSVRKARVSNSQKMPQPKQQVQQGGGGTRRTGSRGDPDHASGNGSAATSASAASAAQSKIFGAETTAGGRDVPELMSTKRRVVETGAGAGEGSGGGAQQPPVKKLKLLKRERTTSAATGAIVPDSPPAAKRNNRPETPALRGAPGRRAAECRAQPFGADLKAEDTDQKETLSRGGSAKQNQRQEAVSRSIPDFRRSAFARKTFPVEPGTSTLRSAAIAASSASSSSPRVALDSHLQRVSEKQDFVGLKTKFHASSSSKKLQAQEHLGASPKSATATGPAVFSGAGGRGNRPNRMKKDHSLDRGGVNAATARAQPPKGCSGGESKPTGTASANDNKAGNTVPCGIHTASSGKSTAETSSTHNQEQELVREAESIMATKERGNNWAYGLLDLFSRTAELEDVHARWRLLMRKFHPDKLVGTNAQNKELFARVVEKVTHAKTVAEADIVRRSHDVPEIVRGIRCACVDDTESRRAFVVTWTPPHVCSECPILKYHIQIFDPQLGSFLTWAVLEGDYHEDARRFIGIEEQNSFKLEEAAMGRLAHVFREEMMKIQILAENKIGMSSPSQYHIRTSMKVPRKRMELLPLPVRVDYAANLRSKRLGATGDLAVEEQQHAAQKLQPEAEAKTGEIEENRDASADRSGMR